MNFDVARISIDQFVCTPYFIVENYNIVSKFVSLLLLVLKFLHSISYNFVTIIIIKIDCSGMDASKRITFALSFKEEKKQYGCKLWLLLDVHAK